MPEQQQPQQEKNDSDQQQCNSLTLELKGETYENYRCKSTGRIQCRN